MRRTTLLGLLLLVPALLLTACGAGPTPVPTIPAPTPQTAPSPSPSAGEQALIIYEVSGGIAGMQRMLAISGNGDAVVTEHGTVVSTGKISSSQLEGLQAQLTRINFFQLKDRYDQGGVADEVFTTITYYQGGQSKSVTVAEVGGAKVAPPDLNALILQLRQLLIDVQSTVTPGASAPVIVTPPGTGTPGVAAPMIPATPPGTGTPGAAPATTP